MNDRIIESADWSIPLSVCYKCKHKYRTEMGCKAFPDGIPDSIGLGKLSHHEIFSNQEGDYVFEEL